jgi:hypothetical protein
VPDFDAKVIGTVLPWADTASTNPIAPSRVNPDPAYPHSFVSLNAGVSPIEVVVHAIVNGVEAPLDGALGGRLFTAMLAEWSGPIPPVLTQDPGQSSITRIQITLLHGGHHLVRLRRTGGGVMAVPFFVNTP